MVKAKERQCLRCEKPIVAEYPSFCTRCKKFVNNEGGHKLSRVRRSFINPVRGLKVRAAWRGGYEGQEMREVAAMEGEWR